MRSWLQHLLQSMAAISAQRSLRNGLDGVLVAGVDRARRALQSGPCIFACTHVSWWDGLIVRDLGPQLGADQRVLVDAQRMEQFSFFSAFGALSIDRSGPTTARAAIRAVGQHLTGPGKALWIFPQGRQLPTSVRPLRLQPGAVWMARRFHAQLVPVALDYRFLESPKPAAFVDFGDPLTQPSLDALHTGLVEGLQRIDDRSSIQLPVHEPDVATRAFGWLWSQTTKDGRHG